MKCVIDNTNGCPMSKAMKSRTDVEGHDMMIHRHNQLYSGYIRLTREIHPGVYMQIKESFRWKAMRAIASWSRNTILKSFF